MLARRILPPTENLLAIALGLLVLAAPLAAGAVRPGARTLVHIASFAILLVAAAWGFETLRRGARAVRAPLVAVCGLALLGICQWLPLPAGLVRLLSPTHAALAEAAAVVTGAPQEGWQRLSLDPGVSLSAALAWASVAAIFVVSAAVGLDRGRRRWLAVAVLGAGISQPLVGAMLAARSGLPRLPGTFVNPDHAALLIEIAMAIAFAWGFVAVRAGRNEPYLERRLLSVAPPFAVWVVLVAGLVYSGSRAGLLAAAGGALLQALLCAVAVRRWRVALAGVLAVGLGFAGIAFLGIRSGFDRLLATPLHGFLFNERLGIWEVAAELIPRFPLTGTGLGTFLEAFPLVQSTEMSGLRWVRAHNDYLELAVTGGLLAVVALAIGLGSMLRSAWRGLRSEVRTEDRAASLALLGACASVGAHELVDFGLTLPANSLVMAVVAGAGLAARYTISRGRVGSRPAAARGPGAPR